jgi:hypothetical protein
MMNLMKATSIALIASTLALPVQAQDLWMPRPVVPPVIYRLRGDALERHVERMVKAGLGPLVDDVDVDVEDRRGRIEVEVELLHPAGLAHLRRLLYGMPELAGYQIKIDVEWND